MENRNTTQAGRPASTKASERTFDSAYGFSFSIAIGLILFIAGLVMSLALGEGGMGFVFGIPLLIAGLAVPLFMMRDVFRRSDIEGACPYCGGSIHTTDATIRLDCPVCSKHLMVKDTKFIKTE
ncbi:MAG TPA: hypothetical protein VK619_06485 [Pyrinomonadaceae bacterium]|nr:hypothetical protein [Pyrinomonadaceae bacterium]